MIDVDELTKSNCTIAPTVLFHQTGDKDLLTIPALNREALEIAQYLSGATVESRENCGASDAVAGPDAESTNPPPIFQ
jgi:hypothetical protein